MIDWDRHRARLDRADPLACRGAVVRVTGHTVESQGPPVGVGRTCEIHLADARRVPAEVVGFHHEHRVLLPLEPIDGIAPNDAVVARTTPRTIRLGPSILGHAMYNWTLRYVPASVVSVSLLGEPVGSTALAFLLLSESPPDTAVIGGAVILMGIVLASWGVGSRQTEMTATST